MKVKKDKFLAAACADLDMETATREHYGYKNKGSTASDASYTIVAKAHVGARMSSSKRRGFMSARPNSVQKGTAAAKKDPIKAKMGRAAKKSMKGKHSYVVSTADLLELAGAYDEMDSWMISQYEEDIKKRGAKLTPEQWLDKMRGGRASAINRARSAMRALDQIGAGSGLEETLRAAARGTVGQAADERIKKMSHAWRTWHQNFLTKHPQHPRAKEIAAMKFDLEDFESRRASVAADPVSHIPLKPEHDASPEAVSKRIKEEMGVGKGPTGTFGLPEEPKPEDLSQFEKARGDSEKSLDEMSNESRSWAVLQWIVKGGAGRYAQVYLNDARRREDEKYASRTRKLRDVFETGKTKGYVREQEEEWPWAKKANLIKDDIQTSTKGVLTPAQQDAIYHLINPMLPAKQHRFKNIQKRLSEIPGKEKLIEAVFNSPSFKGLGAAPERLGAEYIWGQKGTEERDTGNEQAEEVSNLYRGRKQGGLRFSRQLANTMKESLGKYGKTDYDRDLSDIDSSEDVFSWEGRPQGQQAKKEFEAARSLENYFPKMIAERLVNPDKANMLYTQMRRAMFRPEVKMQMEQIVAPRERSGEIVDRQKIRFMLALRADPTLEAAIDENVTGGAGTIVRSMDNEFARENAELMANPIPKLDPSSSDVSKQEHVRNFRRYVNLLRHALPTEDSLPLAKRTTTLGQGPSGNDYNIRERLTAYKDAISGTESKLWGLQNDRQKLMLQYRDAVAHNAPDQQLEIMEQQMDENDRRHESLLNMAQSDIKKFFADPETPNILNRIYNDPYAMKTFTHPEVSQTAEDANTILQAGQKAFQYWDVPYSTYSRLFPDRAADAKERTKQASAREAYRKFGELSSDPTTIPVSSDEESRIQRISTKRAFDALPSLLKEQHLLNKIMKVYPRTDRYTPGELETIKAKYGENITPYDALQRFEQVKKAIDNIKMIAPRSEGEKLIPPLTVTKNGETVPMPEEDRAILLDTIFPGGPFGEYRPPQFGGVIRGSTKQNILGRIYEGRRKEAIVDRAHQLYHDIIRESHAAGKNEPIHPYHDVLKIIGNESTLSSLRNVEQAYIEAAKAELPKEIRKAENLKVEEDEKGFFFTLDDKRLAYTGDNLKYASMLKHYQNQAPDLNYEEIMELTDKKQAMGGILDPDSNARLNMAKLMFSIANDEDKTPPTTPLDNELWMLGSAATGHESAGKMHGTWLKLLPADPKGLVKRAVQSSVSPLYYQWSKFRGSEEPQENEYVFPGLTSPADEAAIGLQHGKRGTESPAELLMRQHERSHPPVNIYGQTPRTYAPPMLPTAFEKNVSSTSTPYEPAAPIGQTVLGQKREWVQGPGGEAIKQGIADPTNPKFQPSPEVLQKKASPRLRDLGSNPQAQTTLNETADVVERFLAKGKRLEVVTQGGEGSGEPVLGVPHPIHSLEVFMRKGARRNMEAAAPMDQFRRSIAANAIPQTNAKNNKAGVDLSMRQKSGSFPGQKPWSVLHKMLITPKDYKIDGGLRG